jgi:uncharacterized protein (DUF305 family)
MPSTTVPVQRDMMYLFRRTLLGLGIAVVTISLVSAAPSPSNVPEEASFISKTDAAMLRMMAGMKITPTGDVDRDFVALMAPHHQGAIALAESELIYGHNEPLRRLAQEIIVTQRQEIAAMRLALGSAAASQSNGPDEVRFLARTDAAMARMMTAMKIKPFNDVDRDFVALMVPHHQGAIEMAEAELRQGRNKPLRRLAQEIIVTQDQQIAAMRLALGEPIPQSVPSSLSHLRATDPCCLII